MDVLSQIVQQSFSREKKIIHFKQLLPILLHYYTKNLQLLYSSTRRKTTTIKAWTARDEKSSNL